MMQHFTFDLCGFLIACLLYFCNGCEILKVTSSSSELSYLHNARFKLAPTLLADGRPVYEELRDDDEPRRLIHHYSHDAHNNNNDNNNNVDYTNIEFYGRWIIGGSLYNGNGWAFLSSWVIEPSNTMIKSYINSPIILNETNDYIENQDDAQRETLNLKDKWSVFINDNWRRASYDELSVTCDNDNNDNNDDLLDWLFVTLRNDTTVSWFRMNITNDFNLNLHGFYYRIGNSYYRKIDSNIFLETLETGRYRFFVYYGYTDSNGIPLFTDIISTNENDDSTTTTNAGIIDPLQFVATNDNNDGSFPYIFNLIRNTTQSEESTNDKDDGGSVETVLENVRIEILHRNNNDETIYDVMREYYNKKKEKSFENGIKTSLINNNIIKPIKKSKGYFSILGVSSNNNNEMELNENDLKIFENVKDKLLIKLNNGMIFNSIGFGTGGLSGFEANRKLIEYAIETGYRVIDSASAYDSETAIGDFIYNLQNNETQTLTRDDLFITTKVWPTNLGFIETQTDLYESIDKINSNYIDLYMIHWPRCMDHFSWMDCTQASGKSYLQTWQIMEKLYAEGRILNLGVSNWDFELWEQLTQANGCQIIPQVVQNYFDIQHQDWELLQYLESWGTIFQGYATYRGVAQADTRAESEPHYLEWKNTLNEIAQRKNNDKTITPAQIILNWLIHSNVSVIPRSHNEDHISDNINLFGFQLTKEEYELLTNKSWEDVKKRIKQEL